MKILGIETSCDETAVCLIEAEGSFDESFKFRVFGNALHSQIATHAPYGGVYPNLAKREHAKNLVPLLSDVLRQARNPQGKNPQGDALRVFQRSEIGAIRKILEREPELFARMVLCPETHGRPDIDAIAVTYGPGLEPALWVGVNFAKALSFVWDTPIVAVNHLEGHITMAAMAIDEPDGYPNVLKNIRIRGHLMTFEFPAIALLISGGHTELDLMLRWMEYQTLGETRDDAVGEAFDKVARMMGLPYPGGAQLSALAESSRTNAEHTRTRAEKYTTPSASSPRKVRVSSALKLPRPMINDDSFDFSFSGLKTAVRNVIGGRLPGQGTLTEAEQLAIAREFEDAAADVLVAKTMRAVEEYGARAVLVGGGVSANIHIRNELASGLQAKGCKLLIPPPELATDNALMITLAGYFHALKKEFVDPATLRANGNLRLGMP